MTVKGWYDTPSLFILQGTLLLSAYNLLDDSRSRGYNKF